MSLFS